MAVVGQMDGYRRRASGVVGNVGSGAARDRIDMRAAGDDIVDGPSEAVEGVVAARTRSHLMDVQPLDSAHVAILVDCAHLEMVVRVARQDRLGDANAFKTQL